MTATVLGTVTLFILGFLVWFYLQLRQATRLLAELDSSRQQRIREVNRAQRLLSKLHTITPVGKDGELLEQLNGHNNMTDEQCEQILEHLEGIELQDDAQFQGLRIDIEDTLGRVSSMRDIEAIWQRRLSLHGNRPSMRFLMKPDRPET